MPDILIRGLDARVVKRLKERAKQNGRSLNAEVKWILEQHVKPKPKTKTNPQATPAEFAEVFEKWKKRFAGRTFGQSSADIIREMREER